MLKILIFIAIIGIVATLPVTKNKEKEKENSSTPATPDVAIALEYERYLKEIVEALESDPEFRKKLDKAPEADIRSGKIAQELDYVNHHVRSKLDEIKRREVDRLRSLATKEYELENDINREHLKIPQHLDHTNEHTFEIEDLKKLIKKTSEDLEEQDKKRRAEFKEYEMQKEFERQSKLKEMDEKHRETYEHEIKEQEEKHKKHEKVHHPGNKAHLEEVWEKQDHMSKDDFDPRSFFMMHDVDSNGFWDENEVKALFVKQLDKVYQEGLPEDDMRERAEEMERMREHVFKETDVNHDNLISFQEFLEYTKREEFAEDPEWETVDQQPQYTHEEYLEFERRRQEEVKRMIDQGLLPPHPNMPQGYYTNNEHAAYQQQFQGQPGAYQQPHGGQPNYQQQQFQGQPGAYQQQPHGHQQVNQPHYQNQQQYQQQPQQQQIYQHQNGQPVQLHPNDVYNHIPQQQPAAPQQQQAQQAAPQQQAQQGVPQNQQFPQQQQQQQHQAVPQQPQQFQQQNQQQQIVVPNQQQQPVVPNQQQQPAASQNQPQAAAPNQQQHK